MGSVSLLPFCLHAFIFIFLCLLMFHARCIWLCFLTGCDHTCIGSLSPSVSTSTGAAMSNASFLPSYHSFCQAPHSIKQRQIRSWALPLLCFAGRQHTQVEAGKEPHSWVRTSGLILLNDLKFFDGRTWREDRARWTWKPWQVSVLGLNDFVKFYSMQYPLCFNIMISFHAVLCHAMVLCACWFSGWSNSFFRFVGEFTCLCLYWRAMIKIIMFDALQ